MPRGPPPCPSGQGELPQAPCFQDLLHPPTPRMLKHCLSCCAPQHLSIQAGQKALLSAQRSVSAPLPFFCKMLENHWLAHLKLPSRDVTSLHELPFFITEEPCFINEEQQDCQDSLTPLMHLLLWRREVPSVCSDFKDCMHCRDNRSGPASRAPAEPEKATPAPAPAQPAAPAAKELSKEELENKLRGTLEEYFSRRDKAELTQTAKVGSLTTHSVTCLASSQLPSWRSLLLQDVLSATVSVFAVPTVQHCLGLQQWH